MKLPDTIERDLQAIEAEYAARGGQQAGTPRLRGLRASIEIALQHLGHEMSFIVHTTNALSDSRKASLVLAEKMTSERDAAREFLGRDLKEAMDRVLTLELECQAARRSEDAAGEGWREALAANVMGLDALDAQQKDFEKRMHDALVVNEARLDQLQNFREALLEYLAWGAMTGSDRDLFEEKFRALVNGTPDLARPPCVKCGASESLDGDWFRLCGSCRWQEGTP